MDYHITIENHEIHNQNSIRMLNKQWNLYDLKETPVCRTLHQRFDPKINVFNKIIASTI